MGLVSNTDCAEERTERARTFEKILVCLDGSHFAEQILPYITEQALCFGSRVVLLQVIARPPYIRSTARPYVIRELMEEFQAEDKEARSYLDRIASSLRRQGVDVEYVPLQGTPGEAGKDILSYAEKNNVDLIAIATHGLSGLKRFLFGSVADFVLRESNLPILLIRPQEAEI